MNLGPLVPRGVAHCRASLMSSCCSFSALPLCQRLSGWRLQRKNSGKQHKTFYLTMYTVRHGNEIKLSEVDNSAASQDRFFFVCFLLSHGKYTSLNPRWQRVPHNRGLPTTPKAQELKTGRGAASNRDLVVLFVCRGRKSAERINTCDVKRQEIVCVCVCKMQACVHFETFIHVSSVTSESISGERSG